MADIRTCANTVSSFERMYFSGNALYGDDFGEDDLKNWCTAEENGYYDLAQTPEEYVYGRHALNRYQGYRFLRGFYPTCLAMGCAAGDDVSPIASQVGRFVAIEPSEKWWQSAINGTPTTYIKPSVHGDIPLANGEVDLVVCLGVLHHIANVSYVLSEVGRVLSPGGVLLIREPISTMGDWRKKRRGVTAQERGFPPRWIEKACDSLRLTLVRKSYCEFPVIPRLARVIRAEPAFNHLSFVYLDAILSVGFSWNLHYHRDTILKKCAPRAIFYMFTKPMPV